MNHNDTPPIAATAPALALIADLAAKYPQLPAPYLTFSTHERATNVGVQCPTLDAFEAWREALDVDPDNMTLFASMINVDAQPVKVSGQKVYMHLYTGGLPALSERPAAELTADCIGIPDDWRALRRQQADPHPYGDPITYGPTGVHCGCGKDAHSNLVPCRPVSTEDPHDSPLHHDYAVPHDLPFIPNPQDRRAL